MAFVRKVLLLMLLLGGVVFIALGPRPTIQSTEDGVVVVRYWEKWSGGNEKRIMEKFVAEYNALQRRNADGDIIRVEYLPVTSVDMKVLLATSANVPPDLAGLWDHTIPSMAQLGALQSFDDLLEERKGWIAPDQRITIDRLRATYKPIFWGACSYEDDLYALCTTPWVTALFWNKELFNKKADQLRAAGLDPSRAPHTIAELDRYAEIIHTEKDGRIDYAGYMPSYPAWLAGYLVYAFDADFYDPQTQQISYDTPEMVEAYEWIASYSVKYRVDMINALQGGVNQSIAARDPFVAGSLAMFFSGPWVINSFEDFNPKGNRWVMSKLEERALPPAERKKNYIWGAAPFPSKHGDKTIGYASANLMVIPRGAEHAQEALDFVLFINRPDVMERLCAETGMPSPLQNVSDAFFENNANPYIDVFERIAASPHVRRLPDIPILPELRNDMDDLVQKVYTLEMSPEQALASSQAKLQRSLDRFMLNQARRDANRKEQRN